MIQSDFITISKKKVEEWRALQDGDVSSNPKWLLQVYDRDDLECVQQHAVFGELRNRYNIHEDPLYWLEARGEVRRKIISIVDNANFDTFILGCIIINCLVEILDMPAFDDEDWASSIRYWSELFFLVIFSFEAALKILALGLFAHRFSYLRSYSNLLDITVVVGSLASFAISGGTSSFTVVRFIRVIRPLRTIRAVKGLRILVCTIQNALAPLFDVMSLLFVVVFTFAVLGVQLWNGKMHQRCYSYEHLANGTTSSNYSLVLNDTAYPCGGGRECEPLTGFDVRCEIHTDLFHVDILHFDNIFSAIFMVVRVVSLDDWPDEMFTVQDASHNASWAYFVVLTLAGGYFLLHMMVAVLSVTYSETIRSLEVLRFNVLPQSKMSGRPMSVGLHHHFLPKDFVRTRRDFHSKKELKPLTAHHNHNRAEDVVARYFGKRQFLEEYLKDFEELRRKEQEIAQWERQVHQLEEVLYEGLQFARRGTATRELPISMSAGNLLGLDVFQMIAGIAFPTSMIPSEAAVFEVGYESMEPKDVKKDTNVATDRPPKWYEARRVRGVASTRGFSIFMFTITTVNVVALSTDYYGISSTHEDFINGVTFTATGFFIAEAGLKIFSLGLKGYFTSKLNTLDFIVTFMSIPEFFVSSSPWIASVRSVRVLKLLSYTSKSQRNVLNAVALAAPQIGSLCILIMLFIYLYTLLGVSLFEGKLPEHERSNYNTFWEAMVATFIMLTGDGWTTVTREGMEGAGTIATIYFTTLFFFGSVILMSLSQAILIDAMTENARLEQSAMRKEAFAKLEAMGLIRGQNGTLVTKRKPQYSAYQKLGNWKAEISAKYNLPFWYNLQTNETVWYNPVAPSNAGGGGGGGGSDNQFDETISWDPTRYETGTADMAITHIKVGEPVDVWWCGNWYPAVVLGRREDGSYSVYYPETGEVTLGVHPSSARPRKTQQPNPLSVTYSQNPLVNGDNDFGRELSPAIPLLERLALPDALIGTETGGLTLLWCALSVKGRWKLQAIWSDPKQKSRLLQHLATDGTLDKMGQPDVGDVINPIELLYGGNRAIVGSKMPNFGGAAISCTKAALLSIRANDHRYEPASQQQLKGMQLGGGGADEDDDVTHGTSNKSLGFITRDNPVRILMTSIVLHRLFDDFMLIIIFVNAIFLALDDYYVEERPGGKRLLEIGNLVFVIIFLSEMISKIIVLGLFKAPRAYLREFWNIIDAAVAIAQLLEIAHSAVGTQFRAMRTIRLLVRFPSIRVVCTVLLKVLPSVLKVTVVGILLWVIFGIIGVSSFKGRMYECSDPTVIYKADCVGTYDAVVGNMSDPSATVVQPRVWGRYRVTFDNIGQAVLTLLEVQSTEGWSSIMWRVVDAGGPDEGPTKNAHPYRVLFFIVFLLIGHFGMVSLFVGTLVNSFFATKHKESALLTASQRNWVRLQKLTKLYDLEWKPTAPLPQEWNGVKLKCFNLHNNPTFDMVIYISIILNCLLLATSYYEMSDGHVSFLFTANIIFVILFILEALIRITALGYVGYFRDPWNRFDFFCIAMSVAGLVLQLNTTIIRVARVVRGIRLLRKAHRLKRIIRTLILSFPAFFNVALLLLYLFFNFGVVGVSMFKNVKENVNLNRHEHFRTLPAAILILYQIATTETWTDVMEGTMLEPPDCEPELDNCGHGVGSIIYFSSALILCSFVFLNLVIFVVIESYIETKPENTHTEPCHDQFILFRNLWVEMDASLTRKLSVDEVLGIMQSLSEPLWVTRNDDRLQWWTLLKNCQSLPVPVSLEREVKYEDCILALGMRAIGVQKSEGVSARGTFARFKKFLDPTCFTLEHIVAARKIENLFLSGRSRRQEEREMAVTKKRLLELKELVRQQNLKRKKRRSIKNRLSILRSGKSSPRGSPRGSTDKKRRTSNPTSSRRHSKP
eukprot:TRINITY_DN251_c8_g1_i2.p1 TRINITY_DN251_c8_g1~~TRINITY_DN251_c8_g1_i2.p1  ORF type:complete len:1907 (+),score=283.84 TRINITY_DN251_c8_g1_i2:95-5815(+)